MIDGAALAQRVARAAGSLADHGVTKGDRVVWRGRPTPESVQVLLAVLYAGAVLVPVSPSATPQEVSHVIADARPVVAITDGDDLFGTDATRTVLPIAARGRSPPSRQAQGLRVRTPIRRPATTR